MEGGGPPRIPRPWWYRWAGKTAATAYIEEMRLVRQGVGISDVSSLGKIDVQGPDAAEFLNRIYVNGFAKLPVGKNLRTYRLNRCDTNSRIKFCRAGSVCRPNACVRLSEGGEVTRCPESEAG